MTARLQKQYIQKRHKRNDCRGFTLLEILVTLAILAIALTAIVQNTTDYVKNSAQLRDRTLAHWVAMNKVAEFQLQAGWPGTGTNKGEAEMANQEWHWQVKVVKTEVEDVRRLNVEVRRERGSKRPLSTVTAFIGRDF